MTALLIILPLLLTLAAILGCCVIAAKREAEEIKRTAATQAWRAKKRCKSDQKEIVRLRAQLAEVARKNAGKNGEVNT